MAYTTWLLAHLFVWGLILLASAGIGRILLVRHTFDSTVERVVFTLALGLGASSFILFLLGLAGLMYTAVFVGMTILFALFNVVTLTRKVKADRFRTWLSQLKAQPTYVLALKVILIVIGLGYWVTLAAGVQYPPMAWDATDEHLVVAREFLAAHGPVAILGIIQPVLPNLTHTLFAWGMAFKDDIIAQMIGHSFMMLTAVGLYALGRRQTSIWLGLALSAFWLSSSLVIWLGDTAYVDPSLICYAFLGVYALRIFWEQRDKRWWYLAMALCGMAAGSKLAGLFFAAAGMLTGLIAFGVSHLSERLRKAKRAEPAQYSAHSINLRSLVAGWAICLIVISPWYGFIFSQTGNPFWPAFTRYSTGFWGAPPVAAYMQLLLNTSPEPRTLSSFLRLPLNWFTDPASFGIGIPTPINPMVIGWPLSWLVALWNREVRWWVIWALSFTVYWFFTAQDLRYWLPALPLAAVALIGSLRWIIERTKTRKLSPAVYLLIAFFCVWWGGSYALPKFINRAVPPLTAHERDVYLSPLGGYDAALYVNQHAKRGDVVALVYGTWLNYYLKPPVFDLFGFLQVRTFPRFSWPEDEHWIRWVEAHGCNWIVVVRAGAPDYLNVPKTVPAANPFWPDYQLVYSRNDAWVFRRKPVPPDMPSKLDGVLLE